MPSNSLTQQATLKCVPGEYLNPLDIPPTFYNSQRRSGDKGIFISTPGILLVLELWQEPKLERVCPFTIAMSNKTIPVLKFIVFLCILAMPAAAQQQRGGDTKQTHEAMKPT